MEARGVQGENVDDDDARGNCCVQGDNRSNDGAKNALVGK